jgi:drug/metabolite transporter (DMT)-like permease
MKVAGTRRTLAQTRGRQSRALRKLEPVTTTTAGTADVHSATRSGWAALLVVWLVWGSTYLAIRVGVRTIPPFTLAAIRYLVAGAIMLPIGWLSGTPEERVRDRPGTRQWAAMLLLGAMLPAAGNGVVSWAEVKLPSGIAALLVGTVPIWMVLADGLLGRRMPGLARWLALGVGLTGVVVLSGGGSGPVAAVAIIATLLAAVSWGVGSALQTRLPVPSRPLLMSGMELFCGGLVLTVVAASRGELTFALDHVTAQSWWALLYLIGPGSLLAMTCYVYALDRLPATTVSTYAFVNPVVAVLLGLLLLNEHLTAEQGVGGALVVLAVAGLLVGPRRRLRSAP